MPRTGRGGTRVGAPGQAYTNRTDLNSQRSLPVRVAQGQQYGQERQQAQAQQLVPMRPAPQPSPAAPAATSTPALPPSIPPGAAGPLERPTERPWEHVMSGAPQGPGPGAEALPQGPSNPLNNQTLSMMLGNIARQSGSQALQALAQRAAGAGQ